MVLLDELNYFSDLPTINSIPIDTYFGQMDLTKAEKEKRIKAAQDFKESLMELFVLISLYRGYAEQLDTETSIYMITIIETFKEQYRAILRQNTEIDEYLNEYVDLFAETVIETTFNHIDEDFFLSEQRATLIGENEANVVFNHTEFEEAKKAGKTKKTWIDIRDRRERATHLEVGGTTLPIDEPFVVGDSLMLYPKDVTTYNPSPKEYINCRCSCKYF